VTLGSGGRPDKGQARAHSTATWRTRRASARNRHTSNRAAASAWRQHDTWGTTPRHGPDRTTHSAPLSLSLSLSLQCTYICSPSGMRQHGTPHSSQTHAQSFVASVLRVIHEHSRARPCWMNADQSKGFGRPEERHLARSDSDASLPFSFSPEQPGRLPRLQPAVVRMPSIRRSSLRYTSYTGSRPRRGAGHRRSAMSPPRVAACRRRRRGRSPVRVQA
jgi:hypothetical protein